MAGCGYVCPICEGTKVLEDGRPCHWCVRLPDAPVIKVPTVVVPPEPTSTVDENEHLIRLANTKMPFGKHAGMHLVNLPETYVLWFKQNGWPEGELGRQLAEICEIKANGLEYLLRPLIK